MADLLSIIRDFNINKKEIIDKDDEVIFGDFAWPKSSKTNYVIWGTNKADSTKDYYTLECVLYLLKHVHLNHAQYVRQAAAAGVPVVRLPDRKDLLAYLSGESSTSDKIDKSAPIDINVQRPVSKRAPAEYEEELPAGGEAPIKRPRVDVDEAGEDEAAIKEKENHLKRLQEKLEESGTKAAVLPQQFEASSLRQVMSLEKIQVLRAKRRVRTRGSIKPDDGAAAEPAAYFGEDLSLLREIVSKERCYKTRNTCLLATTKNFADTILNGLLRSLTAKEKGTASSAHKLQHHQGHHNHHHNHPHHPQHQQQQQQQQHSGTKPQAPVQHVEYSRYYQEKFANRDEAAAFFDIDTTGWGMEGLKAVAGDAPRPSDPRRMQQQQQQQHAARHTGASPALVASGSSSHTKSPRIGGASPSAGAAASPSGGQPQKRSSRTPIIIIPATASLISMLNAKDVLLEKRFVSVEAKREMGARRENEVLIQRMKPDGTTAPFRIVDQPQKLTAEEWQRVCAVFVQGPAWQFKNWPVGNGNPVDIFAKIKAYHLKYVDLPTDANVLKWNVVVLQLDRHKRHLDKAVLQQFWDELDKYMRKHKSHLRF